MSAEHADFIVERLRLSHDIKEVKKELDTLHGVTSVTVDSMHNLVSVDYDSSGVSYDEIENRLNKMGFEIAADASTISTQ